MKIGTYTNEALTSVLNQSKEVLIQALVDEEFLTREQGIKICEDYAITVTEKGILGELWSKILGHLGDGPYITVVKRITHKE